MQILQTLKSINIGDLAYDETQSLYDILDEIEYDSTLEDSKSLEFLFDFYMQNPKLSKKIDSIILSANSSCEIVNHTSGSNAKKDNQSHIRLFADRMGKYPPEQRRQLSAIESRVILLEQNKMHQERVKKSRNENQKIKYLLLVCSDARMGGMFDFDSFDSYAIKPIYVAGNVSAIFSRKEMKNIFSQMDENSAVVIVAHAHCGAVHCAKESAKYAKLKNISDLLKHVDAGGEFQNLQKQIISLSINPDFLKASKKKSIRILGAFANLNSDSVGFRFIDSNSLYRSDKSLERRLDSNFKQSNSDQNLSTKQYAHAIVISSPSLPFDSREIFDCGANEIFCVSASDNSDSKKLAQNSLASAEMALQNLLDEPAIASTEYSVKNNSTNHIVLLHADMSVINAWKRELLQKSDIIYDAIKNSGLRISSMIYDDMTGKTYAIE